MLLYIIGWLSIEDRRLSWPVPTSAVSLLTACARCDCTWMAVCSLPTNTTQLSSTTGRCIQPREQRDHDWWWEHVGKVRRGHLDDSLEIGCMLPIQKVVTANLMQFIMSYWHKP